MKILLALNILNFIYFEIEPLYMVGIYDKSLNLDYTYETSLSYFEANKIILDMKQGLINFNNLDYKRAYITEAK